MEASRVPSLSVRVPGLSEKLRKMAELNLCQECYQKYLMFIHGEIEYLLSEPISDWRQVETDITLLAVKAKGAYKKTNSGIFTPDEKAFKHIQKEKLWKKLKILKETGVLGENLYRFLDEVSKIRNKIHPPNKFSEQDYILFREAKALTTTILTPVLFDLKDDTWNKVLVTVENRAKWLLSKLNSYE